MRVDGLAVELRPRPMGEAADLGVRLVQANAASVWLTCGPVFLFVTLLSLASLGLASWLPALIIFWLKPWMDRSILFVLSRAVFGQPTRFIDLWRAQRSVWWQGLWRCLLLRRLSPWRAFTQSIEQLEGQHGSARRTRRSQLLSGQRGSAGGMQLVFGHIEMILGLSLVVLMMFFTPQSDPTELFSSSLSAIIKLGEALTWVFNSESWIIQGLQALTYAVVVAGLEPLYVAAGFAMYLQPPRPAGVLGHRAGVPPCLCVRPCLPWCWAWASGSRSPHRPPLPPR
jgi:hypothetical protein